MSNKRDLNLEEFGISLSRYRELYYFCQQYREKKEELQRCYSVTSEPTSKRSENTHMLYPYILKNVTEDITYEHMGVPCGRRQFYFMRRKFFCLLDRKKE